MMYSEWASLSSTIQNGSEENYSVLGKLPSAVGKEVAISVVKNLVSNLGLTSQPPEPSSLSTDKEVQWCMEVICYGLSLPLSEHDTIRDCVNVYCEWLSAMESVPKICVPKPICDDPNLYTRKIIQHLHNLFVPRKGEEWPFLYMMEYGADIINRQAVLCHRVLRTLQNMAHKSSRITRETWEALLLFLLAINDALLGPPTLKEDIGDQLCERVLSALFEVWLLACSKCFPPPPLWKTLRESCMRWRHRIALVEQWNRVCLALTARLLEFLYGPTFPELKISEEDAHLCPLNMSRDCIAQSWFRMVHTIGNPVELCQPQVVSQTPPFLQYAISSTNVVEPCHHPCLTILPTIYLKAIKGVASQVDAFLGIAQPLETPDLEAEKKDTSRAGSTPSNSSSPTPPLQRRLAKSFSVAPSAMTKGIPKAALIGLTSSRSSTVHIPTTPNSGPPSTSSISSLGSGSEPKPALAPGRSRCNSILHTYGEWLFEAAHIGYTSSYHVKTGAQPEGSVQRPSSLLLDKSGLSLPPKNPEQSDLPVNLTIDRFESGKAEAYGALCRIFCSKKTGEEILPVYLARFYLALKVGLHIPKDKMCGEVLSSILLNSADLFRCDLDGVNVLIPSLISALEVVLPEREIKMRSALVSRTELRRASIQLLLSLLSLPLHYQNLPIKELCPSADKGIATHVTFALLKPRLMNVLINALQVETDSLNCQMLLGGLMLSVQDSATVEESEKVNQPDSAAGPESSSNLLSSDSAHALFVRATYLVCHRLISSWKQDLNVSLAALELLSGLARTKIKETDALECKRAVKWLCDYISYQCSRPPPSHSKDLHSSIVAAFHCLSTWLVHHPDLLKEKENVMTVMEVVELGISGSKSQGKPGEPLKIKEDKELKPVSMRVRDAADSLLTIVMEQVGNVQNPCSPATMSSMLDEVSLIKYCKGEDVKKEKAIEWFRYFIVDNHILLALLEEPLGNDPDPVPTITAIVRNSFGRYLWHFELRDLPRSKAGLKAEEKDPGRPLPGREKPRRPKKNIKFYPDAAERIPKCKMDSSIPSMDSCYSSDEDMASHKFLGKLVDEAHVREQATSKKEKSQPRHPNYECKPPPRKTEIQTSRLFLSSLGLINLDGVEGISEHPQLTVIDSKMSGFAADLELLDFMSPRTWDTVHLFYVRSKQTTAEQICNNVLIKDGVDPRFLLFLNTLGWPVDVYKHPGWTGHVATSWKLLERPKDLPTEDKNHGGSLFNGDHQVIYWADVGSELAFVVPTLKSRHLTETSAIHANPDLAIPGRPLSAQGMSTDKPSRTLSLDLEKGPPSTISGTSLTGGKDSPSAVRRRRAAMQDTKVVVLWVENFEDTFKPPIADLLSVTSTGLESGPLLRDRQDVFVIYLHPLESDLVRVKLQGPAGSKSLSFAIPLVDGMVASRKVIGNLVRQTALNICRRRRLENDAQHAPHVRRRLKIQDFTQRYKCEMTVPELCLHLFNKINPNLV
ncbi:ral GTPase-activating protein subunit beta isoform X11 [Neocloeon triangulifer]|uniref:ral GTPase-activating protein subunit beta isoform X11 n=1 Tax=Neocloeon triangulifer TaxID=2078957 RepID=UPI00286ECF4E|nr:ral GTPase-activating protein subunit beta isoform X11 [Neocloeon triangulifer]